MLSEDLARLFWSQPVADQAHAVTSARHVAELATDRPELVRAALLHDIGKRHARLGVIGRSVASVVATLRLPLRGRFAAYIEHGEAGAAELESVGAEPLVVAFARHHHGQKPRGVAAADWDALVRADDE
ncbi:MAG TPA: HDIG domain-containing protein [Acidimicrobiia bacterium]|nr:HDIG domain-containing protein [Acidimicrobiia bacterium]